MHPQTVLISGASIAGPALAYWLNRYGYRVTLVEKAQSLRPGGQAVDFKGETHLAVLERMGILDEVRRRQTGKTDLIIVNEDNQPLATIPGEFTGGDVEILRGDLSRLLYERTEVDCEYVFGDSIASLTETKTGVHVTFERGAPRDFDLVIGADGIHSQVRRLAFGPEKKFVHFLGYYYALAGQGGSTSANQGHRAHGLMYNVPGRLASIDAPETPALFVFASEPLDYNHHDVAQHKQIIANAYADVGWKVPSFLAELPHASEVYFDSISRVEMYPYTTGRIALLGDAAYGNTLGGFGTGLAIVGAYILAGELATHDHHRAAFDRYNEQMREYSTGTNDSSAGPFLAPRTKRGIWMRNQLFKRSLLKRMMMKATNTRATGIDLADYPAQVAAND